MEDSTPGALTSKPRGLPRLSRLPRATTSNVHENGSARVSQLPGTTHQSIPKPVLSAATARSTDNVDGTRFGWKSNAGNEFQGLNEASAQERTGYESSVSAMSENSEPTSEALARASPEVASDSLTEISTQTLRKKPRPSLSERTIETMSQIPPSPSRRESSMSMLPPLQPISPVARRSPRPSGLVSPSVQSPSKLISPAPILRPSRNGINSTRNSKDVASVDQRSPGTTTRQFTSDSPAKTTLAAHKVRSLRDLRASAKQPIRKASLNFKDIASVDEKGSLVTQTAHSGGAVTKQRAPIAGTPSRLRKRPSILEKQVEQASAATEDAYGPKSSASLRETIAKAKAAKKQATRTTSVDAAELDANSVPMEHSLDMLAFEGISSQSLKRRVQNAVSSGTLNVAALGLTIVPSEILDMYNTSGDTALNWSEAVDLTKFIIADNEIEELPDAVFPDWSIEELQRDEDKSNIFGGLEILDFRGNKLSQIPIGLRRLERLHTLNLSNNRLTCDVLTILSQLSNLRDLSLANNELSGPLPEEISQLSNLYSLDIHDNKLTEMNVSFSSLAKLRKLNVSGNRLKLLPIAELEVLSITDLNISGNELSNLTLSQDCTFAQTIQNFNLSSNRLAGLWDDAVQFQQLQSLILDGNHLDRIPNVSRYGNLITLTASENRLTELPDGFVELQSLRTANFGSNDIRILDPYISKMENMSAFNITGNPLRERKYLSMSTADLKAELAKRLTAVYVRDDGNATPTAERDPDSSGSSVMYKVEKGCLNLSVKDLEAVEAANLGTASIVHTVDLSKNRLLSFPLEFLCHEKIGESLKILVFSHNVTFDTEAYVTSPIRLPALRSLSLASTGISSLEALTQFVSAPALTELNLCCNRLQGPMPSLKQHFPALTTLLISDNELTSITPDSIAGLEVVDIKNNEIEFLPPKIGELGNIGDEKRPGRLRTFECSGNKFRVPRLVVVEKGTEAILRDLRRMVITDELGEEWRA